MRCSQQTNQGALSSRLREVILTTDVRAADRVVTLAWAQRLRPAATGSPAASLDTEVNDCWRSRSGCAGARQAPGPGERICTDDPGEEHRHRLQPRRAVRRTPGGARVPPGQRNVTATATQSQNSAQGRSAPQARRSRRDRVAEGPAPAQAAQAVPDRGGPRRTSTSPSNRQNESVTACRGIDEERARRGQSRRHSPARRFSGTVRSPSRARPRRSKRSASRSRRGAA